MKTYIGFCFIFTLLYLVTARDRTIRFKENLSNYIDVNLKDPYKYSTKIWPNATVHYYIWSSYIPRKKRVITEAVEEFHKKTCVKFVRVHRKGNANLWIENNNSCESEFGYKRGKAKISFGRCIIKPKVLHHLLRTIGVEKKSKHEYDFVDYLTPDDVTAVNKLYRCPRSVFTKEDALSVVNRARDQPLIKSLTFVNAPSEQHPTEGFTAIINCTISGWPKPEIVWYKKIRDPNSTSDIEVLIDENNFPQYSFEQGGRVLVINKFNTSLDNGHYRCVAIQFGFSIDISERNISVMGSVIPKVRHQSNATEICEGADGQIACVATGVPPPTYSWFKDNVELKNGDVYDLSQIPLHILEIFKTSYSEGGRYTCRASNLLGSDEVNITVTIFLKPTIHNLPNRIRAQNDEEVDIACSYSGGTPLIAKWISPQKTLLTTKLSEASEDPLVYDENAYAVWDEENNTIRLRIRKATVNDIGNYSCYVENKAGSIIRMTSIEMG